MRHEWEPLSNDRFIVRIGNKVIGFSKVTGVELMDESAEVKKIERVGKKQVTSSVIRGSAASNRTGRRSGTSSMKSDHKVTLEKALMSDLKNDDQKYLLSLIDDHVMIESISVEILRNDGSQAAVLEFEKCMLTSFRISALTASESNYINQTLSFYYTKARLSPASPKT